MRAASSCRWCAVSVDRVHRRRDAVSVFFSVVAPLNDSFVFNWRMSFRDTCLAPSQPFLRGRRRQPDCQAAPLRGRCHIQCHHHFASRPSRSSRNRLVSASTPIALSFGLTWCKHLGALIRSTLDIGMGKQAPDCVCTLIWFALCCCCSLLGTSIVFISLIIHLDTIIMSRARVCVVGPLQGRWKTSVWETVVKSLFHLP